MKRINVLSKNVYNRIAAGEVIDRPYSAVKELIENSLDAKASRIEIYIECGGKQLIKVCDNGSGIERDDLPTAFMPHATSKISGVEDLDKITTLGFRGEALASISVIAKVEIISVTEGNHAYKVYCEDGVTGEVQPSALDKGTTVTVRNLFYNTPARAKFMKADKKEEADITSFVMRYILANPDVSFSYYTDGKLALQSFGGGLEEGIAQVYGAKTLAQCYKIDAERNGIHIYGFIGNQNFFKPNKTYQSVFLNGRYIVNNTIATAVSNAYASYAMKRQYPFYVLNVDVPLDMVDVNVHPNKADVRFADNRAVFGTVYTVISAVLDGTAHAAEFVVSETRIPEIKSTSDGDKNKIYSENAVDKPAPEDELRKIIAKYIPESESGESGDEKPVEKTVEKAAPAPQKKPNFDSSAYFDPLSDLPLDKFNGGKNNSLSVADGNIYGDPAVARAKSIEDGYFKSKQEKIEYSALKYKGNLFNTYLIFEAGDSVYFIDQHAAHERLIYDRLKAKLQEKKYVVRQPLLEPYLFFASPEETRFLQENIMVLRNMGFNIAPFGAEAFRIDEVPADLQYINVKDFFTELLSEVDELKDIKLEEILKDKIATTACKHAIKGGKQLTQDEIDALMKMIDGNFGLKCPHGRPVCVSMTKKDFEKMFKRIV